MGLFKKSGSESPVDPPAPRPEPDATLNLPAQLLWLLDAPLFIDNDQVEAFYDAILRPDYEHTSLTLSKSLTNETTIGTQATIGAALPWFGKAQIQASGDFARSSGRGSEVALAPISNTYRHLLALALHYAAPSTPSRLIAKSPPVNLDDEWLTPEYLTALPRAMVFLELPARTKLLPAACECSGEAVAVLADKVEDSLRRQGLDPLRYPGSSAPEDEKNRYYQFLADHYNDHDALEIIEQGAGGQNIEWIAFNVPLGNQGTAPFLRLHIAPRGRYDTGVFAYNFVTRGFNYGLRIVGTLKSGPDVNVLAIFEH